MGRRGDVSCNPASPNVLESFRNRLPRLNLLPPLFARAFGTNYEQGALDRPTQLELRRPVDRVRRRERRCADDVTDSSYRCENFCFSEDRNIVKDKWGHYQAKVEGTNWVNETHEDSNLESNTRR